MLFAQLGEVAGYLRGCHSRSQVVQHVVDRYPRADEAGLAAANASPRLNHRGELHKKKHIQQARCDETTSSEIKQADSLPGCHSQTRRRAKVEATARDAIALWFESGQGHDGDAVVGLETVAECGEHNEAGWFSASGGVDL